MGTNNDKSNGNDIDRALKEWELKVKQDQLTDVDRKVHKTHLAAIKVTMVILVVKLKSRSRKCMWAKI